MSAKYIKGGIASGSGIVAEVEANALASSSQRFDVITNKRW